MRRHIHKELFANMLPKPRIIEDVTGASDDKWLSTSSWPGGPAWKDLPGIARPDLPTSEGETKNKAKVWDLCPRIPIRRFGNIMLAIARSPSMGARTYVPAPVACRQRRPCGRVARGYATMDRPWLGPRGGMRMLNK